MRSGYDGLAANLRYSEKSVPLQLVRGSTVVTRRLVVFGEVVEHGCWLGSRAKSGRRRQGGGGFFRSCREEIVGFDADPHQFRLEFSLVLPIRLQKRFS